MDDKLQDLLTRGVEEIFVKEHLEKRLRSGEKLRIKLGIDPTGPKIHIGRASALRKLKTFQDLGHQIVLIIGDFTARIGDPSDKLEKRPKLTKEQIQENSKNYLDQLGKIIDISKAEIKHNSEWLSKMGFLETAELMDCFTVQQMSRRRNFKERLEKDEDIFVIEYMYPALQGYDSLMINSDVELGGFDQLFNLQAGRVVQKKYGKPQQDIVTLQMLEGTDGQKMSTSWGNVINITDEPNDMYGKVMSLRDELIIKYFILTTDISMGEIKDIEGELAGGTNPKDIKMRLAHEIVRMYHGLDLANSAQADFVTKFQKKEIPEDVMEIKTIKGIALVDVLLAEGIVKSKSEWGRLIDEGAVSNMEGGEKITDIHAKLGESMTLKVGKKRFVKLTAN